MEVFLCIKVMLLLSPQLFTSILSLIFKVKCAFAYFTFGSMLFASRLVVFWDMYAI